jgi:glycosyltransferase involved in cell wall biosynthesis
VTSDVDVVIPVRNAGRLLHRAVDSVLTQHGVHVRAIVIDDGSTDGSPAKLPRDPRIHIVSGRARGIPQALNLGLAECRAPFVARQDADDESLPGRLAAEIEFLEAHEGIGLVATGFETMVGCKTIATTVTQPTRMLDKNPICAGSTVVRRDILERVGGYRPVFRFSSDYDAWLRCADIAGVAILPIVGYRYRLTADMTTVRHASQQRGYAELARASARARMASAPDPAADDPSVPADPHADAAVAEWWAREFAGLGSWRDAVTCLRRLPPRRAARVIGQLVRGPSTQVAWT